MYWKVLKCEKLGVKNLTDGSICKLLEVKKENTKEKQI